MKSRPWPIKILFVCHLFAPLINLVFGAYYTNASIYDFTVFKFYETSFAEKVALLGIVPLAGIVVFICKRWSYFAYLGLMGLLFCFNLYYWQKTPEIYSIQSLAGFFLVNIMVVGYFLIPAVRVVYFNERLRWWESEPRYVVGLLGKVKTEELQYNCKIENISRNGARVSGNLPLKVGTTVAINFVYDNDQFEVQAEVLNQVTNEFGLRFRHDKNSETIIKTVIKKSFAKNFAKRTPDEPALNSFLSWAKRLFTTGKGLVPTPQARDKTEPENDSPS